MQTKQLKIEKLSLRRLSLIEATVMERQRAKTFKRKEEALAALPEKITKHDVVEGLLRDGVTVDEIEDVLNVDRVYARDIIAKVEKKGRRVEKNDAGVFRIKA